MRLEFEEHNIYFSLNVDYHFVASLYASSVAHRSPLLSAPYLLWYSLDGCFAGGVRGAGRVSVGKIASVCCPGRGMYGISGTAAHLLNIAAISPGAFAIGDSRFRIKHRVPEF